MNQRTTRRHFLVKLGRTVGFAGLGALAARLIGRSPKSGASRRREDLCPRCPVLGRCNFPEAAAVRRKLGKSRSSANVPLRDDGVIPEVRGLCGARPTDAPGSRWIRREAT